MTRLDRAQLAAVAAARAPVRLIAGAGTGKTAVIAERFGRLVANGVEPGSVLVMTFTDRAAREMRRRIEDLIGADAPAVGTVHSIALGWLRADGWRVGVPARFRIVTGAERWILARELMWTQGDPVLTADERPDDLVSPMLQMLERLKQELVPLKKLSEWAEASDDQERAELMRACVRLFHSYQNECRRLGLLDFDDVLERAVAMLAADEKLVDAYRRRYPHVLVDEYQDLNLAQERLLELVALGGTPFVAGDDDQSIYRFRGASRASLERFYRRFPEAQTIHLGHNHRSSKKIVAAAAALIGHNDERLPKELTSSRAGARVQVWHLPDRATEASAIAEETARLATGGVPLREIAVLCRTNAITRPIAEALAARGVPHVVVGGQGLLDRPEIRDVVALLRVVRDPADSIAAFRVRARVPAASETLVTELHGLAQSMDVRDLFFELMNRTRYLDNASATVSANVSRLADVIAEFCDRSDDHSLGSYMRHLDLVLLSGEDESPAEVDAAADAVSVMTIHQAKGLEFDVVFVPSLVEGRLPQSGRAMRFQLPPAVLEPLVRGREDVIAEERRLLYVAMTRARRRLYLTRAAHYEGGRRWRDSRFIEEVRKAGVSADRVVPAAAPAEAIPAPGNDGPLTLSFSGIQAYRDCPRQYWFRYEEHLPATQIAEAVQGVILHEVLRRAGEMRREGEEITAPRLRDLHAEVWQATPFPDPRRAPTFKRNGLAQLEAFRASGGFDNAPVLTEEEFKAGVDGFTLRGVIDRVDRTDSGWRIIDYKSGRPVARSRRDLQVALYGIGAAAALDLHQAELEVVYLASGERVVLERINELKAQAVAIASGVADGIRARRFEPQPERRKCRLCPYRLACAEAL